MNMQPAWKGTYGAPGTLKTGHCGTATEGWCNAQVIDAARQTVVTEPGWCRFSVRHGDEYTNPSGQTYSGCRALITGPDACLVGNGAETWAAGKVLWPQDWIGSFPKPDQLNGARNQAEWDAKAQPAQALDNWPRLDGGSTLNWHHQPAQGGVEQGSAPFYGSADAKNVNFVMATQQVFDDYKRGVYNQAPYKVFSVPMLRGTPRAFLIHAKWSPDAAVGFMEAWCDGVKFMDYRGSTLYQDSGGVTDTYFNIGLYRHQSIGDPSLKWPDGSRMYPKDDGYPQSVSVSEWKLGPTRDSVIDAIAGDATPPVGPTGPSAQALAMRDQLVAEKARLDSLATSMRGMIDALGLALAAVTDAQTAIVDVLNKGPP